ncbi:IFT52 [Cordylochernes scorpioides]|uniref:Nuclear transcription factor Y subunit gamma n=1 Tax=Cordylochernes scorpioides TaxID=51811 RepID=A0ABY6L8Z2_9ARAC|nr:IFT52 [Cordylochernes scorpioides]
MISAEAPVLFAKAAEIFITELSLRAWVHTEDNKRRTLQKNDIAMAITKFDQFDFLIDIVPRDELKPATTAGPGATVTKRETSTPQQQGNEAQYYFQLTQQHQAVLQQQQPPAQQQAAAEIQVSPAQQPTLSIPQVLQVQTVQPGDQTSASPVQLQIQQGQQGIQFLQQVLGPNGEIQHIPVSGAATLETMVANLIPTC